MIPKLNTSNKVVGSKQVKIMLIKDKLEIVYVARDAEGNVVNDIIEACKQKQIKVIYVESMKKLGEACGIDVSAASAALLK